MVFFLIKFQVKKIANLQENTCAWVSLCATYKKNPSFLHHYQRDLAHKSGNCRLSIDFTDLENLFSELGFLKDFSIFSAMSENQDSTIRESLKFSGSIIRILKSQKTISLAVQLNRSFVMRQISLKVTGSIYRTLKSLSTISLAKIS